MLYECKEDKMKQLKSPKSDLILNTLSPFDPQVQRYVSLSKDIEHLIDTAEDEYDSCIPVELFAEFFVLQDELYHLSVDKHKKEAN